jgi:hypothetical protein
VMWVESTTGMLFIIDSWLMKSNLSAPTGMYIYTKFNYDFISWVVSAVEVIVMMRMWNSDGIVLNVRMIFVSCNIELQYIVVVVVVD